MKCDVVAFWANYLPASDELINLFQDEIVSGVYSAASQKLQVVILDSRLRGNDDLVWLPVIPAKAGIQ